MITDYEAQAPKPGRRLQITGFILTGIWLAVIATYVICRWSHFTELEPNALGDFAAGAAAPLAFLWLVLGFFQQGQELRNSGKALWLQGKELQASVEQQRQLVEVTRDQLKFESERLGAEREEIERRARPVLRLQSAYSVGGSGKSRQYFRVVNNGNACTEVVVYLEGKKVSNENVLVAGQGIEFFRDFEFGIEFEPFVVLVTFLDARLLPGRSTFTVSGTPGKFVFRDGHEGPLPLIMR